jgi:hypothetical protein
MPIPLLWLLRSAIAMVAIVATGFFPARLHAGILIPGMQLEVGWTVDFNPVSNLFEYRYKIKNSGANNIVDNARWTVAEDRLRGHAGIHDEQNFLNDGGNFQYDRNKPLFPQHNYDWRDLDINAGATVTIGFDDIHGPAMEMWELELGGASIVGILPFAPVPGFATQGEISLDQGGGLKKAYAVVGSAAEPVAGGWNYKYFLRNTGNVVIGPNFIPGVDNHADFYVEEHPTHRGIHHEQFNQPDNAKATLFGFDSPRKPPVVHPHHYFWEGLGDGVAAWAPGVVLTLGFFDPHGPGLVPWGGRVVGSYQEGYFESAQNVVPVPTPEPSTLCISGLGLLGLFGKRLRNKLPNAIKV